MHYTYGHPTELNAEQAINSAISSLQTRILQTPKEEDRQRLRDLLSTCKYVAEQLAGLAWVPSEEDVRRFQSGSVGAGTVLTRQG